MRKLPKKMKHAFIRVFLFAALFAAPQVHAWDWYNSWRMPTDIYKNLDFSVRAGVDRAVKIFAEAVDFERRGGRSTDAIPRYRAAGAEWRKVQVQAEGGDFDETILAYSVFMQGCASECARDRNQALKLYAEVQDLYPDVRWVVVPSRYRYGQTQIDMGEVRKGNETIDALATDPDAAGYACTGDAIAYVANLRWKAGKTSETVDLLRSILTSPEYRKNTPDLWNGTRANLAVDYMVLGNYAAFDELVYPDGVPDDPLKHYNCIRWAVDLFLECANFHGWYWRNRYNERMSLLNPKESTRREKTAASRKAFAKWYAAHRGIYDQANRKMEGLQDDLRIAITHDKVDAIRPRAEALKAAIKAIKDPKKAESYAWEMLNCLYYARLFDLARTVPDVLSDPLAASWMRYSIETRAENWKGAEMMLNEYIARKPNAEGLLRAKWELAGLCRDRLGKPERAVQLYQDINQPPRTLWELQRTYRQMGKKKEAYNVLNELMSIFEKEAPEAVLTAARYHEADGEKEKAIALYRRLLTHPEWKKSGQSSAAHQALERYGIATGGAMVNEVH